MRFLLRYKYGIFQEKTQRLYIKNIQKTEQLLELVASKVNTKISDFILRFRPENGDPLKIIQGWDISHYDMKDGAQLELQIMEKQQQQQSITFSNKYLFNLFGSHKSELANVAEEDQKQEEDLSPSKQIFDPRKYLDQELQVLLKYVQKGKLNSMLKLLRDFPKDITPQATAQIKYLKPKIINELGLGGWGAIHYAVFCKQIQILKQLMKQNVDLNKKTQEGWSPLQLVVNKKNLDQLRELLISPHIDINLVTEKGTALHVAAKGGFALGVQLLLDKGADPKIFDQNGKTVLQVCEDNTCRRLLSPPQETKSVRCQPLDLEQMSHLTILRGSLFKAKPVFSILQPRYFVLDPYQGTFIRFKDEECFPKKPKDIIPLSTITNIKILSSGQKTWQMKKQYTYMEVIHVKKMVLVSKHEEIMNIWFQSLNNSIRFYLKKQNQLMKPKLFLKESDKNIMLLDDENNKFIPIKSKEQQSLPQVKVTKKLTNNQNYDPIMPVSLLSLSSSQNLETNTSFGSELSTSRKLMEKSSTHDDDDFHKINLSYSISKGPQKIQFSNFQIIRQLGSGAFGKVLLTKLKSTGQHFALKALKKRNLILGKQQKFAIQQVNILKQVNHPFIINLNYAFQTPQYLYLALDYCPGGDLNYHRVRQGTFTQKDTRFYVAELILAIQYLHSKKILYRDLKPENILLDQQGHIKLTDFGLSKRNVDSKAKSIVGTHAYASPELLLGNGTDKSADLYGIGCIIYQFLVGDPPYYSHDLPTLLQNIKEAKLQFPMDISDSAKNIIERLLERNPQKRLGCQGMDEVKNHPFFAGLNWEKVIQKQVEIPYRMYLESEEQQLDELVLLNSSSKFSDSDYSQNSRVNRFNNFSFTR